LLLSDINKAIIVYDNTHLRTVLHLRWCTGEGVREDDVMMVLVHPETAHPSSSGIFPSLCHSSATNRE
jgi:hypothetical protein